MKKLIKISLIITILALFGLGFGQKALAESFNITQISLTDFKNHSAKLSWKTNHQAKGTVFYGKDNANLNNYISYPAYDYDHISILSGLEEDETYYFKIVAYNRSGERIETFAQKFSTNKMIDSEAPEFLESTLIQVTQNAALISFKSNEKVKATLYYGKNADNLDKKKSASGYETYNIISITGLTPYARYYARLEIQDKAGNKASTNRLFDFRTGGDIKDGKDFSIYDISPVNFDTQYISDTEIIIKWKTTLAARSYVQYGEKPKKYQEKIYANDGQWSNIHQVKITGLTPNTTYYFKIVAEKSLYNKKSSTDEYFISTIPTQRAVLGEKVTNNSGIDSDNDGLTDEYERSIGTDPYNPDTDNDGYPDGLEVKNGYNPKGPGKLVKLIYGQPRTSLGYEQIKALELKNALDQKMGKWSVNKNDWFKLVNAYVYGNYPLDAISQCVKWSGKTVHPTINWNLWKGSIDYQNYINK